MRDFLSNDIDKLVGKLQAETDTSKQKLEIEKFYQSHVQAEVGSEISQFLGKWLTRFFFFINGLVILLIVIFAGIDIIYHIDAPENRFINGSILGGLITATVAEAVAAFIIFTKFVFK